MSQTFDPDELCRRAEGVRSLARRLDAPGRSRIQCQVSYLERIPQRRGEPWHERFEQH